MKSPKLPAAAANDPVPDALCAALGRALRAARHPGADAPLQPLPDTGLAHRHVRLAGTGLLARLPLNSQLDLPAADNLRHQAACFDRAAPSGHTPRLHAVLPPSDPLPRGGLLVEEIVGRPARLPGDLDVIAQALAALHRQPRPPQPAPLAAPADPLADLAAEIDRQAVHLDAAGLDPAARRDIDALNAAWRRRLAGAARPPVALIAFDAHPGNYVIRPDGRAVLVDLEKCRYGPPGLDLAHATLLTSTTWDIATCASRATLDAAAVAAFYAAWARHAGAAPAAAARPWHADLRRAMALWSLTWCAKWRALSPRPPRADGENWSADDRPDALVAHVRERVDHYLSPAVVRAIAAEIEALEAQAWTA